MDIKMGYLKEKYTREYFLKEDENGNPSEVGVIGVANFRNGEIRENDRLILEKVDFKNKKVIEFGFGRGEAIKYAFDNGAKKVVGVDFAKPSIEIASKMLANYKIEADLFCDDALNFLKNFKKTNNEEVFDIVIMLDFIEHVPRIELKEIFHKLFDFLSAGAIIIINTPIFKEDNDVIKEGIKESAKDNSDEYEATKGMHCNKYTMSSLEKFMEENEFGKISGHIFGKKFKSEINCTKTWKRAINQGYFIKEKITEDRFEFAFTKNELEKMSTISDYNFQNLTQVYFDKFSMLMTERFKEFYIPGKFENFTSDLFFNFLKEESVVIDVGAHYGYYSLLAASKSKKIEVHSFEPVNENFNLLKQNIEENNFANIEAYNLAVSNGSKENDFNITEASDSAGFFEHPLTKTLEKRRIETVSLDDFCQNNFR